MIIRQHFTECGQDFIYAELTCTEIAMEFGEWQIKHDICELKVGRTSRFLNFSAHESFDFITNTTDW